MVDSTADFLNSAQLSPFVRVTENDGFRTKTLAHEAVGEYSKLDRMKRWVLVEKLTQFGEILR